MSYLAIITARSGSKGLPNKNIKELGGTPLMGWTIKAALDSGCFDEVMVSTDSEEYASIARSLGAQVPFLRDESTSGDSASSWDTVKEVITKYKEIGKEFEGFALLQPTSPFRTAEDIRAAFDLKKEKNAKAVVSVCECEHSPLWTGTLPEDLDMGGFISEKAMQQRQKQEKYYRLNGAIYLLETAPFLEGRNLYSQGTAAYVMSNAGSVDIDNIDDFNYAEFILASKASK